MKTKNILGAIIVTLAITGCATEGGHTYVGAYDATPNVYYRMRANRKHRGIFVIIDSQIEKKSTNRSKITISYWLNKNSVNPTPYGESLTKRAKHALNI
jgi:hypothetical protein